MKLIRMVCIKFCLMSIILAIVFGGFVWVLSNVYANEAQAAVTIWTQAFKYNNAGEHQKAVELLQRIIKHNPRYLRAYIAIADIYNSSGNFLDAEEWYNKALAVYDQNVALHLKISTFYFKYSDNKKAEHACERAIALLDVDNYEKEYFKRQLQKQLYLARGRIAELRDDYMSALQLYYQAILLGPHDYGVIDSFRGLCEDFFFIITMTAQTEDNFRSKPDLLNYVLLYKQTSHNFFKAHTELFYCILCIALMLIVYVYNVIVCMVKRLLYEKKYD